MSLSSGEITYPVDLDDIRRAIIVSSGDLATLCKSSKINKWAKYKPVIFAVKSTMDELNDDKTWFDIDDYSRGDIPWWRATDGKCGLTINTFTTGSALISGYNSGNEWTHNHPYGTTSSPYRQIDFNHYVHSTTYKPVAVYMQAPVDDDEYVHYVGRSIGVHFTINSSGNNQLKITDFLNTGHGGVWSFMDDNEVYCGVLAVYGSNMAWATNPDPIGSDPSSSSSETSVGKWERNVLIPAGQLPDEAGHTIQFYPFFTRDILNSAVEATSTSWTDDGVITCPIDRSGLYARSQEVTIVSNMQNCTCSIRSGSGGYNFYFELVVNNESGASDFTATSAEFFICQTQADTMESYTGEKYEGRPIITSKLTSISGLSFTVQAGRSVTFSSTTLFSSSAISANNAVGGLAGQDVDGNAIEDVFFGLILYGASNPNLGNSHQYVNLT